MAGRLHRSIDQALRERLTYEERWEGADRGLIWCWELGRNMRVDDPGLAARAEAGELVSFVWKRGSLQYLATWQGLRARDLDIDPAGEHRIVCTKEDKEHTFKA